MILWDDLPPTNLEIALQLQFTRQYRDGLPCAADDTCQVPIRQFDAKSTATGRELTAFHGLVYEQMNQPFSLGPEQQRFQSRSTPCRRNLIRRVVPSVTSECCFICSRIEFARNHHNGQLFHGFHELSLRAYGKQQQFTKHFFGINDGKDHQFAFADQVVQLDASRRDEQHRVILIQR